MTQEEKAKAYDEVLERAKQLLETSVAFDRFTIERIFPELTETEDEKIRKDLIKFIKKRARSGCDYDYDKWIEWLEKQDKKKSKDGYTFKSIPRLLEMIEPTDKAKSYCEKLISSLQTEGYITDAKIVTDCLKTMNGIKVGMATMDGQTDDDKIKPKFHKGDWIVFNGFTLYVIEVINGFYKTISKGGITNSYDWYIDNIARLWTIEDANPGDVLTDSEREGIFIYAGSTDVYAKFYVALGRHGDLYTPSDTGHWEKRVKYILLQRNNAIYYSKK